AGHGECGAPLTGPGLCCDAFQALFFGVVGLGYSGVQLMAATGVAALKFIVDSRWGTQLFLQLIGPNQWRRPKGAVVISYFLRNIEKPCLVVQLLSGQFVAEHGGKLLV